MIEFAVGLNCLWCYLFVVVFIVDRGLSGFDAVFVVWF